MENENAKFTKWAEGLKLKPYRCTANKLTIGYGRNLEDNGITESEAEFLLTTDLDKIDSLLLKHYPTIVKYQQTWRCIFKDMIYNMGFTKFTTMKRLIAAVSEAKRGEAMAELLDSNWFSQVGRRSKALFNSAWHCMLPDEYLGIASTSEAIDKDFRYCFTKWLDHCDYGQKTNRERFGKRPRIAKWIKAFGL